MIYAYIRVSTERQNTENQRHEIDRFAQSKNLTIDKWVSEKISSTKRLEERALHTLLRKLRTEDILIVSEISRVGRNLMQIMSILNLCMERNVRVLAIKEGYELGDNINSKVLAFAFGLSAEIERNLISLRTREAMARLKAEGKPLGRPSGSRTKMPKLAQHTEYIRKKLAAGYTQKMIATKLKVHRQTVSTWIKAHGLATPI